MFSTVCAGTLPIPASVAPATRQQRVVIFIAALLPGWPVFIARPEFTMLARNASSQRGGDTMRPVIVMAALAAILWPGAGEPRALPPGGQKRPPLVLKSHGIFWAGGRIVTRTQTGNEAAGDLKEIPYNQQQVLA